MTYTAANASAIWVRRGIGVVSCAPALRPRQWSTFTNRVGLLGTEVGPAPDSIDAVVGVLDQEAEGEALVGPVAVAAERTADGVARLVAVELDEAPEGLADGHGLQRELHPRKA